MSYAGTYGPEETCEHDCYRRNCWQCNGSVERFAREFPARLVHPEDAESIEVTKRVVTLYDASCPNRLCEWKRHGVEGREKIKQAIADHIADCRRVATDWDSASDIKSEATARGLLKVAKPKNN